MKKFFSVVIAGILALSFCPKTLAGVITEEKHIDSLERVLEPLPFALPDNIEKELVDGKINALSINSQIVKTDVSPVFTTYDGKRELFVPLRVVAENLGYKVTWEKSKQCIILQKHGTSIYLYTKNSILVICDREKIMVDDLFIIKDNRVLVDYAVFQAIFNRDITYEVVQGDHLAGISSAFYGSPDGYTLIMEANGMAANSPLIVGQVLIIPRDETADIQFNPETKQLELTSHKAEDKSKTFSAAFAAGWHDSSNALVWEGLQKASLSGIEARYVEAAGDDEIFETLSNGEFDIIWTADFPAADALLASAKKHPNQLYGIVDYTYDETPSNVIIIMFNHQEASFLTGYMAAKTTETGKIGFIGGRDLPMIKDFEIGYRAGVVYASKESGKEIEVISKFADTFADKEKGEEMADILYAGGCDIIFVVAGYTGHGAFDVAKETGNFAIDYSIDKSDIAPENVLWSTCDFIENAIYDTMRRLVEGEDLGGQTLLLGLKENAVGFYESEATKKPVNPEVLAETFAVRQQIIDGGIIVPSTQEQLDVYE